MKVFNAVTLEEFVPYELNLKLEDMVNEAFERLKDLYFEEIQELASSEVVEYLQAQIEDLNNKYEGDQKNKNLDLRTIGYNLAKNRLVSALRIRDHIEFILQQGKHETIRDIEKTTIEITHGAALFQLLRFYRQELARVRLISPSLQLDNTGIVVQLDDFKPCQKTNSSDKTSVPKLEDLDPYKKNMTVAEVAGPGLWNLIEILQIDSWNEEKDLDPAGVIDLLERRIKIIEDNAEYQDIESGPKDDWGLRTWGFYLAAKAETNTTRIQDLEPHIRAMEQRCQRSNVPYYPDLELANLAIGVVDYQKLRSCKEKLKMYKFAYFPQLSTRAEATPRTNKLVWEGTPAQMATIIHTLAEKGYIKLDTSSERNAELLLSIFDIVGGKGQTSKGSLGKLFQRLKNDESVVNAEDASKFLKIPKREDLKN